MAGRLTLSEINAAGAVRAVLDAVHSAADPVDVTDEDFGHAMTALEVLASRQPRMCEQTAILEIVTTLKRLREATS